MSYLHKIYACLTQRLVLPLQIVSLLGTFGAVPSAQPQTGQASNTQTIKPETDPPIDRFEDAIKSFEEADKSNPPVPGCTVFVGSSTFEHWKTLEQEFSRFKAVNRGFGGSTIRECTYYAGRIVTKYQPRRIVFYAGTNDIADNVPGEAVFDRFVAFVSRVRQDMPAVEIDFISMSMAPCRTQWEKEYELANSKIQMYISNDPHLRYIDVTAAMRGEDGKVRAEFFGPDQLHMNADGYIIWRKLITDALNSFDGAQT